MAKALNSVFGSSFVKLANGEYMPQYTYKIYVTAGTYNENIAMESYEKIFGGYVPGSWSRDIQNQKTIITQPVVGVDLSRIDGCVLTQGIVCENASPTISNNIIYNPNSIAVLCRSTSYSVLNNNVIRSSATGILIENGTNSNPSFDLWLENNTIVQNETGIYILTTDPSGAIVFKNNIITFNSSYGLREGTGSPDPENVDYNDFYNPGAVNYYDKNLGNLYTVSEINNLPEAEHNLVSDPLFVNPSAFDFRLQAVSDGFPVNSPCIDAGNPDAGYNDSSSPPGKGTATNDIGATGGAGAQTSSELPIPPAPKSFEYNFDQAVIRYTVGKNGTIGIPQEFDKFNCFTMVYLAYTGKYRYFSDANQLFTALGVADGGLTFSRRTNFVVSENDFPGDPNTLEQKSDGLYSKFKKGYLVTRRWNTQSDPLQAGHAMIATGLCILNDAGQELYAGSCPNPQFYPVDEIFQYGTMRLGLLRRTICRTRVSYISVLQYTWKIYRPTKPWLFEFPQPYQP
ncbi:MAG: right-handed parallel beta-helix repeat-containing protein [bacterium]|nr:right-handed parallel beta-helix repeat-containing protein [bacterium]